MSGVDTTTPLKDDYTREDVPCIICGIKDEEFQFNTPERLVQCRRCGLYYNNPRLDLESRKKIYAEDYFVVGSKAAGLDYKAYENYIADEPLVIKTVHRRMQKIEAALGSKGRLLDVGCATGFSLIAAEQRGWQAEGLEFSKFCVDYAHGLGLKVQQGTLKSYQGSTENFDAITMWDYLEHSPEPLDDLKICEQLLRPGGVIFLSIPNIDSWSFKLSKEKWIGFKNIDHLYFYSRKTMARLAGMAGLNMERSFYHGRDVALAFFLSRIQYYVAFKPLQRVLEKIAALQTVKNISFYLNPYDILNIVLRKPYLTKGCPDGKK